MSGIAGVAFGCRIVNDLCMYLCKLLIVGTIKRARESSMGSRV